MALRNSGTTSPLSQRRDSAAIAALLVDQRGIRAGLADQPLRLVFATFGTQRLPARLVVVQAGEHLFGLAVFDQPGEVVEDEPGLVVDQQRASNRCCRKK
ncbi:hypothetical protein P4234_15625 [Pseudomonas aeruginosa]|nr:hypothetical protein [Pseudomonas aeruginosa]